MRVRQLRSSAQGLSLLSAVACSATGCALVDSTIKLELGGVGTGRCVDRRPPPVLLTVIDRRRIRDRVGIKKNGYGMETAAVRVEGTRPVGEWLQRALSRELAAGGLALASIERPGRRYVRIGVALDDLFVEPKVVFLSMHAHALVRLEAVVELPDGRRFGRRFKGHNVDTFNFGSAGEYQAALSAASRSAIRKLARSICGLLVAEAREGGS